MKKYFYYLYSFIKNFFFSNKIFYVVEYVKWANYNDAINLKKFFKKKLIITNEIYGIKNSIIHVGTHYKLFDKKGFKNIDQTNKLIVFWPHFDRKNYISSFLKKNISKIYKINTCSLNTKTELIKFGIPVRKILYTPLAFDKKIFYNIKEKKKMELKEKYSIPKNKLILGSFVKDGVGFEKGNIAKKIKNPQMLIKSLKKLKYKQDLFFVLSGPARGYLKNELKKLNINYFHKYCSSPNELAELYRLVDITIINSNLEGGPYSLLESLASGVPVISTKVGMATEVIKNNYNGYLLNINDHRSLTIKIHQLRKNRKKIELLKMNSIKSARPYSIENIGTKYYKKIYELN